MRFYSGTQLKLRPALPVILMTVLFRCSADSADIIGLLFRLFSHYGSHRCQYRPVSGRVGHRRFWPSPWRSKPTRDQLPFRNLCHFRFRDTQGWLHSLESGVEGTGEEIGWRITKIRHWQGIFVILPNTKLSDAVVTDFRETRSLHGIRGGRRSQLQFRFGKSGAG